MTKTFTPKPGDKWTRDEDGMLWVYRKDCAVVFSRTGFTAGPVTCRSAHERELPTPDALAQLRLWWYEVSGDEKPITESRVKEIVAQMLAAHPTPAESAATNELRVDLRDGDTWRGFGTSMVQVRGNRCRQCDATEVGEWFGADGIKNRDVFPFDKAIARLANWGYRIECDFTTQPTPAEVREAAKVASDPNTKWHNITTKIVDPKEAVAPEPDWKGLLANVVEAWKQSYFSGTEAVDRVVNFNTSPALAAAREYLKDGK